MKKKVLSLVVIISMVMTLSWGMLGVKVHAIYTPTNDAYVLVNYLNNQVGKAYTANRCQAFVYNSLVNALGVYGAKACAYEAWLDFGVSTDRDIPLGAAVYFSGGSYPCGSHIAGHVGLYVGDGYVVHVAQSKVQKTLVSSIESWRGYSYLGWGWQGGYALATYEPDYTEAPTNAWISANYDVASPYDSVTLAWVLIIRWNIGCIYIRMVRTTELVRLTDLCIKILSKNQKGRCLHLLFLCAIKPKRKTFIYCNGWGNMLK